MPDTIELHVPLTPTPGLTEDEYQFPWIDEIDAAIDELVDGGVLEIEDDSAEVDGHYVYFLGGSNEQQLLAAAGRLANLDRVPAGAFAVVDGSRVELND